MKKLFVIPARGGSKGVPGKNVKELCGKPLLYYSIDLARQFVTDENICLTSEDIRIIEKAESYGLKVPFVRPEELATDTATSQSVILHAYKYFQQQGRSFDLIVLLQPTSPFRRVYDVHQSLALYTSDIDMVVSVKKTKSNPYFTLFEEDGNGFLQKSKDAAFTRRQDCPHVFELNGALYIINPKSLLQKPMEEFAKIKKCIMPEEYSVDIDTDEDWFWAEYLMNTGRIKLDFKL